MIAYFSIIKRLFIYLTPLIPLSFKGEGEDIKKRGEASLRLPSRISLKALDKVRVCGRRIS